MHYAMGFAVEAIGEHRAIWHNGYSPKAGGYCLNAIFPEDDLAVIVLSNSPDSPFRGQPEKIVKNVLALMVPGVGSRKKPQLRPPCRMIRRCMLGR
jgi:hypothetical protein